MNTNSPGGPCQTTYFLMVGSGPSAEEASPQNDTLDLAVIRSLARLTDGDLAPFAEAIDPPDAVGRWLDDADRARVNGVLIQALRRWHQIEHAQQSVAPTNS